MLGVDKKQLIASRQMVTHVERRHHEDHVFGDVRRMIANPLEMARDQDQVERRLDRALILEHVREQIAEDLCFQAVEPVVLVYLNRLSDLLYILARGANAQDGVAEPLWKPGESRGS